MTRSRRRFRPVTPYDVADDNPTVIARRLSALQRDVRDGFEMLANRIMTRLDAQESRLDRVEDHITELRRTRAEERKRR